MKIYRKETFKTRSEWLSARGIGGSSASAILGVNPWQTPLGLYNSIVFSKEGEREEEKRTPALDYGSGAEGLIRRIHALDGQNLGQWRVIGPGRLHAMYRRKDKPWMTATIDGTVVEPDGRKGVLEIKTHDIRGREDRESWESNQLPQNYYVQVLHYLAVLNDYQFAVLVAKLRYFDYSSGERRLDRTEIRYYRIERLDKQAEIDLLEEKETSFWEENVQKRVPPKVLIGF